MPHDPYTAAKEGNPNMTLKPDTFTRAYLECAFWADAPEDQPDSSWLDLAPEALERAIKECAAFQEANAEDLAALDTDQAGHDFWLTRNRHGAGYWDRGNGAIGDRLTDAAHMAGERTLYTGDDGRVYMD